MTIYLKLNINIKKSIHFSLVWIFLSIGFLVSSASPSMADERSAVLAVWVADKKGVVSIDPRNGTVLQRISGLAGIRSLAVDVRRNRVWAYGRDTLHLFDGDGNRLITRSFSSSSKKGDDDESLDHRRPQLVSDPHDGGVWLARGRSLHRLDAAANPVFHRTFKHKIAALAFDAKRSRLWLAERRGSTLLAFDVRGGVEIESVLDGKRPRIRDIAFDAVMDRLWIALAKGGIRAVDASGQPVFEKNDGHKKKKIRWLTADGRGGVWFTRKKQLVHLHDGDETGHSLKRLGLKNGRIRNMALDPGDHTLWMVADGGLRHVDETGTILLSLDVSKKRRKTVLGKRVRAMALALATEPPKLEIATPVEGAMVNDPRPALTLLFEEYADPDTILVQIDETPLPVTCQPATDGAVCRPDAPLADGPIRLSVTIANHFGIRSEPKVRGFTIDTVPPVITLQTPTDGLLTNQPLQTLAGHLSEPALLSINGQSVPVDGQNGFSWPITLAEGENRLLLIASDAAGNRGTLSIGITLDTQPPTLTIITPEPGRFTSDTTPTIDLEMADDAELASLAFQINGEPLAVDCQPNAGGASCLPGMPLADGGYDMTVTVDDAAGNRSEPARTTFTIDTVAPRITLTAPAENTLTNRGTVTVSGQLSEPALLTLNGQPLTTDDQYGFQADYSLVEGKNALTLLATDRAGNITSADRTVFLDTQKPVLTYTAPAAGAVVGDPAPVITLTFDGDADLATLSVSVNGDSDGVLCETVVAAARCQPRQPLADGSVQVLAHITDAAGNVSDPATLEFTVDTTPPSITLIQPEEGTWTNRADLTVSGSLNESGTVTINGQTMTVAADLTFQTILTLQEGENSLTIVANDQVGNTAAISRQVILDTQPPAAPNADFITVSPLSDGTVRIDGAAGGVEAWSTVTVDNETSGASLTVLALIDGVLSATIAAAPGDGLTLYASDRAGNRGPSITLSIEDLPPDPVTVAPELDATVPTTVAAAGEFLYSGDNPIQTGVEPGTIEPKRAVVVRGSATDATGAVMTGVTVSMLGHAEFGQTKTRADGVLDMAANGGGWLTVVYEKEGYLPVHRKVKAGWGEWLNLPEVVMTPLDEKKTTITLGDSLNMQVAQGSPVADDDGERQATVLFPVGVTATMTLPDGSSQPFADGRITVRATEYTVGDTGPRAMPGELPANSGYTYAVELSVDEAMAAGAERVDFSQPVPLYVDNFLGFPVGGIVPVGYYDRVKAAWIPSDNGRVIGILTEENGRAVLDLDGSGQPATTELLSAHGINDAELEKLAQLYEPGQSLWRAPITHFTPWDCNWPYGPPVDAVAPPVPADVAADAANCPEGEKCTTNTEEGAPAKPINDPCHQSGSIIECENRVLGESIPIAGTPFSLHYRSNRQAGWDDKTYQVLLSGSEVPASLSAIQLELEVAGRKFSKSFPPDPNQTYAFQWDGLDAYGRPVQGLTKIHGEVRYIYPGAYYQPSEFEQSFGRFGNRSVEAIRSREEISIGRPFSGTVGSHDSLSDGFGGWSLSSRHVYIPEKEGGMLLKGDGGQRTFDGNDPRLGNLVTTFGGIDRYMYSYGCADEELGDGGPVEEACLTWVTDMDIAPDGSIYVLDYLNYRIRKITPDGVINTVPEGEFSYSIYSLALMPDGSLVTQRTYSSSLMRLTPEGEKVFFGGRRFRGTNGIAVDRDGSIYASVSYYNQIKKIWPDGSVTVVAGTGEEGYSGDGGPAVQAQLNSPSNLVMAEDGTIYFAEFVNKTIRKISPDGIISTFAGGGAKLFVDNGDLATDLKSLVASGIRIASNGNLFVSDYQNHVVWRITPGGRIYKHAGKISEYGRDVVDAIPEDSLFFFPQDVLIHPDGSLLVSDYNFKIQQIAPQAAGLGEEVFIPSQDGSEVYGFRSDGVHVATFHPLTGAVLYRFDYDLNGLLVTIEDGDGDITRIERDGEGRPLAIVSPDDQRTVLTLDTDGYLIAVADPTGQSHTMAYTADGLLNRFVTPKRDHFTFQYEVDGRLLREDNPAGSSWTLVKGNLEGGQRVTLTSALGRERLYESKRYLDGEFLRTQTAADGTVTESRLTPDGLKVTTTADGTLIETEQKPDDRFGMIAPVTTMTRITTPGGLVHSTRGSRAVEMANANDLLAPTHLTETTTVNGRPFTSVYDGVSRTFTATSPASRITTATIDGQGRPTHSQTTGLAATSQAYDDRGRLIRITRGDGSEVRETGLNYGTDGFLKSITDPLLRTTSFTRDTVGRVLTQTLPGGRTVRFDYDANGNLTQLTPPGRDVHQFFYTALDQESEYFPPPVDDGDPKTRYFYDLDKDLERISRPDGQEIIFTRDPLKGRLTTITVPRGAYGFDYDTVGRIATLSDPDGGALAFTYDGSLPLSTTWSGAVNGTVSQSYDNDFRITSRTVNGVAVTYQQDADGFLTRAGSLTLDRNPDNGQLTGTSLSTVLTQRGYNPFGETTTYNANRYGTDLFQTTYQRDKLGRIIQKTETIDGITTLFDYAYDLAGRLIEVKTNGTVTASYTYDENGNRLTRTANGLTDSGLYDAQDRLVTYGDNEYTHTANGERLTKRDANGAITTYAYDVFGNLRTVTLADGHQIDYLIDAANRRIGKKVDGTLIQGFLYRDDLNPIAELDGTGNVVSRFIYADKANVPAYMTKNGATYRYITDHLGSPRLLVNVSSGEIAQRIDYDEFGQVILDNNPGFQPFGFAGGLYDTDTGLVRFGARDYDPQVGRWTAKDPIRFGGDGPNLYGYVLGDPVNLIDPEGKYLVQVGGAILGGISGGVGAFIASEGDITQTAIGTVAGAGVGVLATFVPVSSMISNVAVKNLLLGSRTFFSGFLSSLAGQYLGSINTNKPVDPVIAIASGGGAVLGSSLPHLPMMLGRSPVSSAMVEGLFSGGAENIVNSCR